MADRMDADRRRRFTQLTALAVLAIAVRILAVFLVRSYQLERVTYEHGEIARNLVEGRGFTVRWLGAEGPTSQQAPVYPTLVAVFYWLFGTGTPTALLSLQILQAILGGILPVAVVVLSKELLPDCRGEAWIAGLGVALYPTLIYAATQVQVASLVSLLLIGTLWLAARVARSGRTRDAVWCGITAAVLVLTDPIMVLALGVALIVIAWPRARLSIRHAAVTMTAFLAVVAPWIVRNYRVHGEFVFVKSTFGYAFWQGNHPRSFGTDKIPRPRSPVAATSEGWSLRSLEQSLWRTRLIDTMYIDDAVLTRDRVQQLSLLSEPARSRNLLAESLSGIRADPLRYVRLCLVRLRYFLLFDETNPKSQVGIYRVSHMTLQLLAAAGLWLSIGSWRQLWPTYLIFGLIAAFHTLTIVSARFHLPVEPVQWIWAGFTCVAAARSLKRLIAAHPDPAVATGRFVAGISSG